MIIQGGRGTGWSAGVNEENRLITEAVNTSAEHHVNHYSRLSFNSVFEITTENVATRCFYYLKNSDDTDISVEGLTIALDKATEITVELGNIGDPDSGTAVTPVNLNVGSGNVADGTFEVGEDLGNAGATLTGGATCERYVYTAALQSTTLNFEQDIIVRKNSVLTLWSSVAQVKVQGTLIFNYHNVGFAI